MYLTFLSFSGTLFLKAQKSTQPGLEVFSKPLVSLPWSAAAGFVPLVQLAHIRLLAQQNKEKWLSMFCLY